MTKSILFILAGAWIALLLVEKSTATAGALAGRKRAWPVKAGGYGIRMLKGILMIGLLLLNVYMALSLVGDRTGD
ncbi:MAG: hypothetical protein GF418_11550 [Chitinivibrionales bacterium]|nr:hypothetical protein [Chitinivibrionales bacterium]